MGLRSKIFTFLVGLPLAGALHGHLQAAALPVPQDLVSDSEAKTLTLRWKAVEGAGLYRVAIFDAPDKKDNKRPLLAAVWVKGTQYIYGQTATVPKAGTFPSTKPLPLPAGGHLRVMVAAAKSDGSDKGEWAGLDVDAPAGVKAAASPSPTAIPTAIPTEMPGAVSATGEAELEVQGGEEFKQSPDAAVLDVDEAAVEAEAGAGESSAPGLSAAALAAGTTLAPAGANAVAAGSPTAPSAGSGQASSAGSGQASSGTPATIEASKSQTVEGATPAGEAKGLLASGRFEQAETAFRAMLEKDPTSADAWEGLGDSFAGRRMKLEAKESYEKALELNKGKTHLRSWIDKNVRR